MAGDDARELLRHHRVADVELSVRSIRALMNHFGEDATMADVLGMSRRELMKIKNIGSRSANEILDMVAHITGHRGNHLEQVEEYRNHVLDVILQEAQQWERLYYLNLKTGNVDSVDRCAAAYRALKALMEKLR